MRIAEDAMRLLLFRNSVNPVEYCATNAKADRKLPPLPRKGQWQFYDELENAMHAAVFGVINFDAAINEIAIRGYYRYTDPRRLRNAS
jgi:hypothetical protein